MSNYWRWIYIEDDIGSITVTIIATVTSRNSISHYRDDDVYVEIYVIRIFKNLKLTLGYYCQNFIGLVRLSKEATEYLLNEYDINYIIKESEPK